MWVSTFLKIMKRQSSFSLCFFTVFFLVMTFVKNEPLRDWSEAEKQTVSDWVMHVFRVHWLSLLYRWAERRRSVRREFLEIHPRFLTLIEEDALIRKSCCKGDKLQKKNGICPSRLSDIRPKVSRTVGGRTCLSNWLVVNVLWPNTLWKKWFLLVSYFCQELKPTGESLQEKERNLL